MPRDNDNRTDEMSARALLRVSSWGKQKKQNLVQRVAENGPYFLHRRRRHPMWRVKDLFVLNGGDGVVRQRYFRQLCP